MLNKPLLVIYTDLNSANKVKDNLKKTLHQEYYGECNITHFDLPEVDLQNISHSITNINVTVEESLNGKIVVLISGDVHINGPQKDIFISARANMKDEPVLTPRYYLIPCKDRSKSLHLISFDLNVIKPRVCVLANGDSVPFVDL